MKPSIFIPKRLNVGFCERRDTYTGKLAYVIYYDEKNKLRKETSWNNWRDANIPNEEYDNEPIEGFVLNKKVGDYKYGWNHRHAYCRVYDPRGFEFEISIENLLFILENVSCIKGKGLEGEFVYGWEGKDLVLVPVESAEYKEIIEYSNIIHNHDTIKQKELKIGRTYIDKDGCKWIYMGKHNCYDYGYIYFDDETHKVVEVQKEIDIPKQQKAWDRYESTKVCVGERLVFARLEQGWVEALYETYKCMPRKFIKCVSEQCSPVYQDIVSDMKRCRQFHPVNHSKTVTIKYDFEEFKQYCEFHRGYKDHFYSWGVRIASDTGFIYIVRRDNTDKEKFIVEMSSNDNELLDYKFPERIGKRNKFRNEHIHDMQKRFEDYIYSNVGRQGDVKYTTSPLNLQELYEKLKPSYIASYLDTGEEFEISYNII